MATASAGPLGQRYGRWTVIGTAAATRWGQTRLWARCDCGTERSVLAAALKHGHTQGCGCVRKRVRCRPPRTESLTRLAKRTLQTGALLYPETVTGKPKTWGECQQKGLGSPSRPCPYISCAAHLALEVTFAGSVSINPRALPIFTDADGVPSIDLQAMPATCALYEASKESLTLEEVGAALGTVRERIRQIEERALRRLSVLTDSRTLARDYDVEVPAEFVSLRALRYQQRAFMQGQGLLQRAIGDAE